MAAPLSVDIMPVTRLRSVEIDMKFNSIRMPGISGSVKSYSVIGIAAFMVLMELLILFLPVQMAGMKTAMVQNGKAMRELTEKIPGFLEGRIRNVQIQKKK